MARDMTKGGEAKLIFLFTLPIMAGNLLQQLYNTADSVIVGNFVSKAALAAVGTSAPLTFFLIALALGLSTGSGVVIAQLYGAKKYDELRKAVSTCIILLISIGLALSVAGGFISKLLLRYVMSVPEEVMGDASLYLTIYCVGLVFQFAYNIAAAILRAVGDSRATLYFLLVSSVLNIALDLLFVVVFKWGVAGAAVATVIAQCASAVTSFIYMFRRYELLRFSRSQMVFDGKMCRVALKMGIPTTLQQCVVSCGHIALQRLINSFGTDLMSALTGAQKLESYILVPIFGFAAGLSTFTGQNVGAGQMARVRTGLRKTLVMSSVCCLALSAVAYLGAEPLVRLFGLEGYSLELGVVYLHMVAPVFIIFSVYQMLTALLQGTGDVIYSGACTLISLVVRVILSYTLATAFIAASPELGAVAGCRAICIALPVGWVIALGMAFVRYLMGTWKKKAVAGGESVGG